MRRILRFDLDAYLSGHARELGVERPLYLSKNQPYIEYRKGSLVFYRLRDEIGEAALNRALKSFLDHHRYKTSPYATSRDLLDFTRAATPPGKQQLVTELFERIVIYDNRMAGATARRRSDGRWDVTMQVHLARSEADGKAAKQRCLSSPASRHHPGTVALLTRDFNFTAPPAALQPTLPASPARRLYAARRYDG